MFLAPFARPARFKFGISKVHFLYGTVHLSLLHECMGQCGAVAAFAGTCINDHGLHDDTIQPPDTPCKSICQRVSYS